MQQQQQQEFHAADAAGGKDTKSATAGKAMFDFFEKLKNKNLESG